LEGVAQAVAVTTLLSHPDTLLLGVPEVLPLSIPDTLLLEERVGKLSTVGVTRAVRKGEGVVPREGVERITGERVGSV